MPLNGLAARAIPRHAHFMKRIASHQRRQLDDNSNDDPFAAWSSAVFGPSVNGHNHQNTHVNDPIPTAAAAPPKALTPTDGSLSPTDDDSSDLTDSSAPLSTSSTSPANAIASSTTTTPPPSSTSSTAAAAAATTTSKSLATSSVHPSSGASTAGTTSSTNSHSTGIAIGVTLSLVALFALIAVAWLVRKRKMRERAQWRSSWKAGLYPALNSKREGWETQEPTAQTKLMSEKALYEPKTPTTPDLSKPLPDPQLQNVIITPPPNTLNNPTNTIYQTPNMIGGTGFGSNTSQQEAARVRRGFLPSLPDELPITIGETIHVITAYDDGWSLCRNSRGEKGMVPLECLDRNGNHNATTLQNEMAHQEANGDQWRMSKRASSLYAGVTPRDGY